MGHFSIADLSTYINMSSLFPFILPVQHSILIFQAFQKSSLFRSLLSSMHPEVSSVFSIVPSHQPFDTHACCIPLCLIPPAPLAANRFCVLGHTSSALASFVHRYRLARFPVTALLGIHVYQHEARGFCADPWVWYVCYKKSYPTCSRFFNPQTFCNLQTFFNFQFFFTSSHFFTSQPFEQLSQPFEQLQY